MPRKPARAADSNCGLTPRELAKRYRCSTEKVRGWIKSGALRAVNLADSATAKPRFVVMPEALAEFEQKRAAAAPKPAVVKRPRRPSNFVDYFPGS